MRTIPILWLFLTWCPFPVISQTPPVFHNLSYENGLSQSTINCILQDRDGMIWLGTEGGLNCFDGYAIRSFQQEPGNEKSLSNDNIQCLAETKEGRLLIGTMGGGLNIFNKETLLFDRYQSIDSLPLLPDNTVWALMVDPDGTIWAGTSKGLSRIDLVSHTSKTYEPDTTGINGYIFVLSLCRTLSGNRILMGTTNGLYLLDPGSERISSIDGFGKIPNPDRPVWSIGLDSEGIAWMGTNSGLISLDPDLINPIPEIIRIPGSESQVTWSVLPVSKKEIWLGTLDGLIVFNPQTRSFQVNKHHDGDPRSIPHDVIWCLMQDRSGIIWAGTRNGLGRHDPFELKFNTVDLQNYGCRPEDVVAVLEDKNKNLWIGTDGKGLYRINLLTSRCEIIRSGSNGLTSDHIWSLLEDRKGRIWIGTYGGGLCCKYPGQDGFVSFRSRPGCLSCLSNDRIYALEEDREGLIWIGTRGGGLCRLNPETHRFSCFLNDPDNDRSISGNAILSLCADRQGHLWIGTFGNGLSCLDLQTETFTNFNQLGPENRYLPDNNIWSVTIDHKERLWLGTSMGICLIPEPVNNFGFLHLGTREGLPKGIVMGIIQDPLQNLWMSTFNGLSRLNPDSLEIWFQGPDHHRPELFRNYDHDEGLQSKQFGQGAYAISDDGYICFGGVNGVNRFRAEQVRDNPYLPPVRLTSFKVFNQEVPVDPEIPCRDGVAEVMEKDAKYFIPRHISFVKSLIISSKNKVISFEFSSLHYSRPWKNEYAYMLENFDQSWNFSGTKHDATYTNLPPGRYTFKVKGTNSDGVWNPVPMMMKIIVKPMFHQTILFYALVGLILAGFLTSLLVLVSQSHRNKVRRDKEFAVLQLKTIKNQIDPHFTFNMINNIGGMVIKGNPDRAYDYFSRFARLIRTSLDNSDRLIVTLSEEIDFVVNYLELQKARFPDDLDYSIHISPDVRLETEVPKMIIQIFAENSMKHGLKQKKGAKRLSIRIYMVEKELVMEIEDNGIGRDQALLQREARSGKGYEIINKLSMLYQQIYNKVITYNVVDLSHDDSSPAGTRVDVVIR